MNSPSIAGVSHTMRACSSSASADFAWTELIRTRRWFSSPTGVMASPVPIETGPALPSISANTVHAPFEPFSATASCGARRKPRPGDR